MKNAFRGLFLILLLPFCAKAQDGCPVDLGPDTLFVCPGEEVVLSAHNVPEAATGTICQTVLENGTLTMTAPAGAVFTDVIFASYGTPNGSCGSYTTSSCHASSSVAIVEAAALGNGSFTIEAANDIFDDPCPGLPKRLTVEMEYSSLITPPSVVWSDGSTASDFVFVADSSAWIAVELDDQGVLCEDSIFISPQAVNLNLGVDTLSVCAPAEVLLSAPGSFNEYNWSTGESTPSITVSVSGVFSLSVTDSIGCVASDSAVISILDARLDFASQRFCAGTEVQFTLETDTEPLLQTVLWNDGSTSEQSNYTVFSDTLVQVEVSNGLFSCTDSAQILVSTPEVNFETDTITRCGFEAETLTGPPGYALYNWSTGEDTQSISYNTSGLYSLTVTDSLGCTSSDSLRAYVLGQGIVQGDTTICAATLFEANVNELIMEGESGTICDTAIEINDESITLTAPPGAVITSIDFASYGTPTGSCGNFEIGNCHSGNTLQIVEAACLGQNSCTVEASNDVFADPCQGINKILAVEATWSGAVTSADIEWSTGAETPGVALYPDEDLWLVSTVSFNGLACSDSIQIEVNNPSLSFAEDTLTFCGVDTLQVNAPAGYSTYLWSDGSTADGIEVTESGVYELIVTDSLFCADTAAVWVSLMSAEIGPDSLFLCQGDEITFAVDSDAGTFPQNINWFDGSEDESYTYTALSDTTVSVEVSNGLITCYDTVNVALSLPFVDLGPDTLSVCGGEGFSLEAGLGYAAYDWSTGASTASIEPFQFGEYSVQVTDSLGCQASDTIYLWVLGSGIMPSDTTICIGDSLDLFVENIPQINNSGTVCGTATEQSGSLTLTAPAGTVFNSIDFASYGTASGSCGSFAIGACHAASSSQIVESLCLGQSTCTIPVDNDTFVDPCDGTGKWLTVQASYGQSEVYADILWSTGETDELINVAPQSQSVYTLEVSNEDLTCTDEITVDVSNPVLQLMNDTISLCAVDSVLLEAPAGFEAYFWSNGSTDQQNYVSFSDTYTVTGQDAFGCEVSDSVLVSIVNGEIMTPDTIICIGDSAQLVVNDPNLSGSQFYFNDFEAPVGNEWSRTDRVNIDDSQVFGNFANETVTLNLQGLPPHQEVTVSFTFYAIDSWDGNGSNGDELWTWTADGENVLSTNFTSFSNKSQCYPYDCPASNPYGTTSEGVIDGFCFAMDGFKYMISKTIPHSGSSLEMQFSAAGLQSLCDESWAFDDFSVQVVSEVSYSDILWSTGETADSIIVAPDSLEWYHVVISDGVMTCTDSVQVNVSNPQASFDQDSILLCSLSEYPIALEQEWESYLWSTAETTDTIAISATGTYTVEVTDSIGCATQDSLYAYFAEMQIQQEDTSVCVGTSLLLEVLDDSQAYFWSNGVNNDPFTFTPAGDTLLIASYENGIGQCADSVFIRVSDLELDLDLVNVSCFGAADGTALATADGGILPYQFDWGGSDPLALTPEAHFLALTDSIGCSLDTTFVITQPLPLVASASGLFNACNDSIVLNWSAAGGTEPFTLNWSQGSTPTTPGSYNFTVVDQNGCSFENSLSLEASSETCGCTYEEACNYDPAATSDDGSCTYPAEGFDCAGNEVCAPTGVEGCTYEDACNYDPAAETDNGTCTYPLEGYDCAGNCIADYNNNGVCDLEEITGCTYENGFNYDPAATVDDGNCNFSCTGDFNGDDLVNSSDLLQFLGIFGTACP